MEWVETTGRTIEDAKEAALDELGVDEQEAEFEIVEEPKIGLFGRLRSEGRVRARVRPVAPPAKDDRRRRPRNAAKNPSPVTAEAQIVPPATENDGRAAEQESGRGRRPEARNRPRGASAKNVEAAGVEAAGVEAAEPPGPAPSGGGPRRNPQRARGTADAERNPRSATPATGAGKETGRARPARSSDRQSGNRESSKGDGVEVDVSLEEQSRVAEGFLRGLVGEFGVEAEIASNQPDESTLDLALTGEDLGMLIGPRGATLLAIQDLTRTVVQRRTGASNGRIHVDVGGYRKKRSEALSRFAVQVAEQVRETGVRKALEPMSAPDRKVVHDALTEVDGVSTVSEGEDSARRVVILPADG